MKQNRLIRLLATGALSAIALTTVFGQGSSTTTTTSAVTTNSVSGTGTITAYTPGADYITVRTGTSSEPVKYYYTKSTTIVDPEGKTVEWSAIKPDMPVKYTYVKEGDRMIIRQITLAKPVVTEEKTTTTTTTTQP